LTGAFLEFLTSSGYSIQIVTATGWGRQYNSNKEDNMYYLEMMELFCWFTDPNHMTEATSEVVDLLCDRLGTEFDNLMIRYGG